MFITQPGAGAGAPPWFYHLYLPPRPMGEAHGLGRVPNQLWVALQERNPKLKGPESFITGSRHSCPVLWRKTWFSVFPALFTIPTSLKRWSGTKGRQHLTLKAHPRQTDSMGTVVHKVPTDECDGVFTKRCSIRFQFDEHCFPMTQLIHSGVLTNSKESSYLYI